MEKKKSPKIHRVFVPLTSFAISDVHSHPLDDKPATINASWDIPNTDIKLVRLSKGVTISKESDEPVFNENVFLGDTPLEVQTMFPSHNNLSFNSGFLFPFTQPDPDTLSIFPHTFENHIRTPLLFLRLFCPGSIFAPYAFIEGVEVVNLHDFHQGSRDGHSYIYERQVENFLAFYKKYSELADSLYKVATKNPKTVFEEWYKRLNNAIYFFGKTYFTSERNHMNPDARNENNLRLIYLCTALDALIGSGNPSGKDLASKADLLLVNIIGAIKKDVENFYDERSRYVHANPNTMGGETPNKTIDRFSIYIQKLILVSLELSGDGEFVTALTASRQKHWFSFYEKSGLYSQFGIKKITRRAFEGVSKFKDGYELADPKFIESKINIWSKEPPGFSI